MEIENVRIVEIPADRWREYRALRLAALRSDPNAFGSTYEQSVRYSDDFWRARLTNPAAILLFAERDGRLIGTAGALLGADEDPAAAQIVGVFVEAEQRGRGIGRRLIETLLARIARRTEIDRVQLSVTETQAAAIALYRSLGFEAVGRLVGESCRGDQCVDELVMERANR